MLPGFNHNVRYRERVFHVQTEDNGLNDPRLITQLFLEGHVLAVERAAYGDLIIEGRALVEPLRERMQNQHKSVLKQLVQGGYDAHLDLFLSNDVPSVDFDVDIDVELSAVDAELDPALLEASELLPIASEEMTRRPSSPSRPRASVLGPETPLPPDIEDVQLDDIMERIGEWEAPTSARPRETAPSSSGPRPRPSSSQDTLVDVRLPAALRAAQERLKNETMGAPTKEPSIRRVALRSSVPAAPRQPSDPRAETKEAPPPGRRGPTTGRAHPRGSNIPSNDQTMLEIDPAALKAAMARQRARLEAQKKQNRPDSEPIVVSEPSLDDVIMGYLKDEE